MDNYFLDIFSINIYEKFESLSKEQASSDTKIYYSEPTKNKWSKAHDKVEMEYEIKLASLKQKIFYYNASSKQKKSDFEAKIKVLKKKRKLQHAEIRRQRVAETACKISNNISFIE